jgi:hypothetical protein
LKSWSTIWGSAVSLRMVSAVPMNSRLRFSKALYRLVSFSGLGALHFEISGGLTCG